MQATPGRRSERERGQVIVLFALGLVVLLGMLALILDGGRVYTERRRVQNAADAAATAGAAALDAANVSGTYQAAQSAACSAAAANGYGSGLGPTCGPAGSVVQVHVPSSPDGVDGLTSGLPGALPQFEKPGYVQVSITSNFQPFIGGVLGFKSLAASALAVAVNIPSNGAGYALLVLDPIDCGALFLNGNNSAITVYGGTQVDSDAWHTKGSTSPCTSQNAAVIKSATLTTYDDAGKNLGPNNVVGNGDSGATPPWTPNADPVPDPLTDVHVPPLGSAAWTSIPGQPGTQYGPQLWTNSKAKPFPDASTGETLPPGVIWGGMTVGTGDTLVLQGGTYIMAGGGFNVSGGTVSAIGPVTLIYTIDPYCNTNNAGSCTTPGLKANGDLPASTGQSTGGGSSGGSWGLPAGTGTGPLRAPCEGDLFGAGCKSGTPPSAYSYLNNILIYVDRNVGPCQVTSGAPNGNTNLTAGGSGSYYFDAGSIIYSPCGTVSLYGNGASTGGAVVAYRVQISGTKSLNLGGPGTPIGNPSKTGLVQ